MQSRIAQRQPIKTNKNAKGWMRFNHNTANRIKRNAKRMGLKITFTEDCGEVIVRYFVRDEREVRDAVYASSFEAINNRWKKNRRDYALRASLASMTPEQRQLHRELMGI